LHEITNVVHPTLENQAVIIS